MARKKISTTIYLDRWQTVALKELQRRTRVTGAEYIREGITAVLNAHGFQRSEVERVLEETEALTESTRDTVMARLMAVARNGGNA